MSDKILFSCWILDVNGLSFHLKEIAAFSKSKQSVINSLWRLLFLLRNPKLGYSQYKGWGDDKDAFWYPDSFRIVRKIFLRLEIENFLNINFYIQKRNFWWTKKTYIHPSNPKKVIQSSNNFQHLRWWSKNTKKKSLDKNFLIRRV